MFSIVCVFNEETLLTNFLLKGLRNQTSKYELILVDNRQGEYKSAARGLNWGGKKAKGKYIMFVHQDVDLCCNTWLEEAEKLVASLPDMGICGVAGKRSEEGVITIIKHGEPPHNVGNSDVDRPTEVQTLDECLVIIPKSVFDVLQFDEKVCDDWHLYAVDYSLSVTRLGYKVYVIPMFIYHRSTGLRTFGKSRVQTVFSRGPLPKGYYKTLKKVLVKHRGHFRKIYTTLGDWDTARRPIGKTIEHLARGGIKVLTRTVKPK